MSEIQNVSTALQNESFERGISIEKEKLVGKDHKSCFIDEDFHRGYDDILD